MDEVTRRDALKLAAVGVALAGAGAAAAAESPGQEKHDTKQLEARVKDLSQGLAKLGDEKDFEELMRIIRKPGWTTPAEFMLVMGVVDAMHAHTKVMAGLKQVLLTGSRAVTAK